MAQAPIAMTEKHLGELKAEAAGSTFAAGGRFMERPGRTIPDLNEKVKWQQVTLAPG
jgi:hypothetical protein